MGSHNIEEHLSGDHTQEEVSTWFDTERGSCEVEYGTDPYNGTWSTIRNIHFPFGEKVQDMDYKTALDYCLEHAEKWDHCIAIKYKQNDKVEWTIAGWAAD